MHRNYLRILGLATTLVTTGAVATISAGDDVPFPTGFRDWFAVNSMIVTKDSPISGQIGGMHLIYVNAKGLPTLKGAGPFPYPDGTIFADEVHEFSVKDGSYVEGSKKAVTVMIKDAKKYLTNGDGDFKFGLAATLRSHLCLMPPMPLRLASSATHRRKIRTLHSQLNSLRLDLTFTFTSRSWPSEANVYEISTRGPQQDQWILRPLV